ncbi:hypothetical protein F4809DRAFT_49600 [Biscogniauxia mediterranea]|nr:hypothetical protein F4809DRAFT_49600 [Biscogniauxia mediterranea]
MNVLLHTLPLPTITPPPQLSTPFPLFLLVYLVFGSLVPISYPGISSINTGKIEVIYSFVFNSFFFFSSSCLIFNFCRDGSTLG